MCRWRSHAPVAVMKRSGCCEGDVSQSRARVFWVAKVLNEKVIRMPAGKRGTSEEREMEMKHILLLE